MPIFQTRPKTQKDGVIKKFLSNSQKTLLDQKQRNESLHDLLQEIESSQEVKKRTSALHSLVKHRLSIYVGVGLTIFMVLFSAIFFVTHIRIPPLPKSHKSSLHLRTQKTAHLPNKLALPLSSSLFQLSRHVIEQQRVLNQINETIVNLMTRPQAYHAAYLSYLTDYSLLSRDIQKQIAKTISAMKRAHPSPQSPMAFHDFISQSLSIKRNH